MNKLFQTSLSWENLKIRFISRLKHLNFWFLHIGVQILMYIYGPFVVNGEVIHTISGT